MSYAMSMVSENSVFQALFPFFPRTTDNQGGGFRGLAVSLATLIAEKSHILGPRTIRSHDLGRRWAQKKQSESGGSLSCGLFTELPFFLEEFLTKRRSSLLISAVSHPLPQTPVQIIARFFGGGGAANRKRKNININFWGVHRIRPPFVLGRLAAPNYSREERRSPKDTGENP